MAIALLAGCSEGEMPEPSHVTQRPGTGTFNPTTLFTDLSCTKLQDGVTKEQIIENAQEPYRTMALQMLEGTYNTEFRIMDVEALPDPELDAALNKTSTYGLMDNPTGISVTLGDTLRVFVSGLSSTAATFKIQTLSTQTTGGYGLGPDGITLANGENVIPIPRLAGDEGKGLCYVRYYYNSATKPSNIKINVFGGQVNGYFDPIRKQHDDSDWTRIVNAAVNPYFDICGEYSAATMPLDWVKSKTKGRGVDLTKAYDAVVYLEWKFMGLLDPPLGFGGYHRTRGYFHQEVMNEGVGAYAAGNHTAFPGDYMASPDGIVGSDVWVFGHEHGHVNQTRPGFRWDGLGEVTNNLTAMFLRTHVKELLPFSTNTALNTNLQNVGDDGYLNTYERAFNWFFGRDRPGVTPTPHYRNDNNAHLFHKLVPFWQLYLYLDNVLGKTGTHGVSFYEDIYEHYRKDDPNADKRSDGEHQLYFVELVCDKAKLNLADFFEKTGFLQAYRDDKSGFNVTQAMVEATLKKIQEYPLPDYPQPFEYITDGNAYIFKEKLALGTGSPAEVNKNGKFTVIPAGWTNAVAFEVRADGPDGDIKCVYTADNNNVIEQKFDNGFRLNPSDGLHLYAVGQDGERKEVQVTIQTTTRN
jgi:hypothetical protein